jgi:hypothetical protein
MAGIETWAIRHSIPGNEILYFFEQGDKHQKQLEWMVERDDMATDPLFRRKEEVFGIQCADFIAYHQLQAASGSPIESLSGRVIGILETCSHSWRTMDMTDPDRLPYILQIPLRDQSMVYRWEVLRRKGVRRAVVTYHPRKARQEKMKRSAIVLPERKTLSPDYIDAAISEYNARKNRG